MLRDAKTGRLPCAPRRDQPFNVLLSALDVTMLAELANQLRVSKGQVLRQLLASGYLMTCEGQPTCASGMACLVAHLHNRQGVVPHMSNATGMGPAPGQGSELGERRG